MADSLSLTYCGNVHPATDVDQWIDMARRFAVPIAASQRTSDRTFGLGTWWNAATAAQLGGDAEMFGRVRDFLEAESLAIWTVNVFPYGDFHGTPVKEQVYRPDWTTDERVRYTLDVAGVVARLGSDRTIVPMSTLPLGHEPGEWALHAANLMRVVHGLHELHDRHGVHLVLALEPEPFCLAETVGGVAEFLETHVFHGPDEPLARRHLGVCIDLCHLAVVGEDPATALLDLQRRDIQCPKIQVSSCLELRDGAELDLLLAFDEPVYLHQTVATDGTRAWDLPEVARRREEFVAAGVLRTHFHMPVFWDDGGALGSTRALLLRALAEMPGPLPLLEVETYTWGVLPGWDKSDDALRAGIARELDFIRGVVADRSF